MPELCRFYGIIIRMFYDEHEQPHFHAAYQGKVVQIGIDPLMIMRGRLHRRAIGLIMEWATARSAHCWRTGSACAARNRQRRLNHWSSLR